MKNKKIKSGIKSSVFWTGILTSIVVAIAAEFGISIEETSIAGFITAIVTFVTSRFVIKKKAANSKKM
ncbi:MAG: phage holin [Holosporales bacterium]|jgi:uncharacterized membrane protein|nr:phage holin [Holosporales bacterium]